MALKQFLFIRHAKTHSNMERRYTGAFDEPLCKEGLREIEVIVRSAKLPPVTTLISSPSLRCRQTAELLFPGMDYRVCPMTEIDFGVFSGKNADDLSDNSDYRQWLDSGGMDPIPGGESVTAFKNRCCSTFARIAKKSKPGVTAMVIHGGNIMAILERFSLPQKNFYSYHVPNCGYYLCRYESKALFVLSDESPT